MLERMFEKQDCLKFLTHPYSSSRNTQLDWMQSDSYADGMPADTLSKYESEIEKCNETWRTQLAEVESNVGGDIRHVRRNNTDPI